jgi:hypothetical protein
MSRVFGALLVFIGFILGLPFAVMGFAFRFIKASFETGEGCAVLLSQWIDRL